MNFRNTLNANSGQGPNQNPSPQTSPSNTPTFHQYFQNTAQTFQQYGQMLQKSNVLEEQLYYHGVLPREEINLLLRQDGDFLVRESIKGMESQLVLSVHWQKPQHFIINQKIQGNTRYFGTDPSHNYQSVPQMVLDLFSKRQSVDSSTGALLLTPVFKERWELSNDDIQPEKLIGKGTLGEVWKAKLRIRNGDKVSYVDVAAKICKMEVPDKDKAQFLKEARLLRDFSHPNITGFIGVCATKFPIILATEFISGGSLDAYLQKNRASTQFQHRLAFINDILAGMAYLESKGCIHRDLAARNCLLTSHFIVKITDFGMSRTGQQYAVQQFGAPRSVKWSAPEALANGIFTFKSDVWSFGVVMWEIFNDGALPFANLSDPQAMDAIAKQGLRLNQPAGCPGEVYQFMRDCWADDPERRPHFVVLQANWQQLFAKYRSTVKVKQVV